MTIAQRNTTSFYIIALMAGLLLLLTLIPLYLFFSETLKSSAGRIFFNLNYIYSVILILYSALSLSAARLFFFKTNSMEIFFFMLFLSTFIFEISRPVIILVNEFDMPFNYSMFLSRTAYFGKICGTSSLFLSALFSSDIETRKLDTPIIVIIVLSFLLSTSMPLSDYLLQNTYYKPGFFRNFIISFVFIDFLTILIFIINFFQKRNNEYFYLALGLALIVAGRELSFYFTTPSYFISGVVSMIAGTVIFIIKLHRIYKWY